MYLEPPEPFLQTSLIKVEEHKISCREEPTEPPKQVVFRLPYEKQTGIKWEGPAEPPEPVA